MFIQLCLNKQKAPEQYWCFMGIELSFNALIYLAFATMGWRFHALAVPAASTIAVLVRITNLSTPVKFMAQLTCHFVDPQTQFSCV
jgi:hypothetical protein